MKRSEVAALLTIIEAAEKSGREPTDEDVRLWQAFATEGAWESYDAALRAYVVHRSEQPNFPLRPGHITQVLERVRREASADFNRRELDPPQAALDDPREYARWVRTEGARHRAAVMARFVAGDRPALRAIEAAS